MIRIGNFDEFENRKERITLIRNNNRCLLCKENDPDLLEIHHVTHFADGGEHKTDNLVTLCKHCHEKVGRGKKRDRKPRAIRGVD